VAEASPLGGVRRRRRLVVGVGVGCFATGVPGAALVDRVRGRFAAGAVDGGVVVDRVRGRFVAGAVDAGVVVDRVRGRFAAGAVDAGVVDAGARRVERVDADVVAAAGPGVDRSAVADLLVGDVDADAPTARFVPVVAFAVAGVEAIPGVPTARVPTPEVPAAGFAATDRRLGVVVAPPDPAPADAERADPAADRGPGLRPRLGVGPTDDFAGDVAGGLTGETAVAASTAADPTAVAASVATSPASPIAARAQSPIRPTTVATSAAASSSCRRRFAICFRPCFASARASCSIRRVSVARAASSFLPSLARSRAARFVNGSAAARADATRSPAAARTSAGTLEIVCFPDRFDAFAITRLRSGRSDIWVSERHGTVPS
jgi:hypothetical protein